MPGPAPAFCSPVPALASGCRCYHETLMQIRYAHTNIIAEDWQALAEFYCAVFHCVPQPPGRRQSGRWLEKGTAVNDAELQGMHLRLPGYDFPGCEENGPTLEIYQYAQILDRPEAAANRKGYGHIAFQVDDVEQVRRQVLMHGGQSLGEISQTEVEGVGHLTFTYMKDPEGNIVEIQQWD